MLQSNIILLLSCFRCLALQSSKAAKSVLPVIYLRFAWTLPALSQTKKAS
jgi:hypothetical protein